MTQPEAEPPINGSVVLSSVVMAHPARSSLAAELCRRHPELNMRIVYDPDPTGRPNPARTAALAWGAVGPDATHHLVVQDDVFMCERFSENLRLAVTMQPATPLALFVHWGTGRNGQLARLAALKGHSWCPLPDASFPGVATVLPRDIALGLSEFLHRHNGERLGQDSILMVDYFARHGLTPSCCVPNLAEHDRAVLRASVGRETDVIRGLRRSACYIDDATGLSIGGEPMPLPEFLPHQGAFHEFWPYQRLDVTFSVTSSHRRGPGEWNDQRTLDWLVARGWPEAELVSLFRQSLKLTDSDPLRDVLGEAMLFESWLTSFATGTQLEPAALTATLPTPAARAALATALPGPLWRLLPPELTLRLCETSIEFTQHAVCTGSEMSQPAAREVAPDESGHGLRVSGERVSAPFPTYPGRRDPRPSPAPA